jgi:serine phosphatase RsbU (regulator of sigma subunit)
MIFLKIDKPAHRLFKKALDLFEELGDHWGKGLCYEFLAFQYLLRGEYAQTLEYCNQSYEQFSKVGDIRELGIVYNIQNICYYYLSDYKKATLANNKYEESSFRSNNLYGLSASYVDHSLNHLEQGNIGKAKEYAQHALDLAETKHMHYPTCLAYNQLGYVCMEEGDYLQAVSYLNKAKQLNESYEFLRNWSNQVYIFRAEAMLKLMKDKYETVHEFKKNSVDYHELKRAVYQAVKHTKAWNNLHGIALRIYGNYLSFLEKSKEAEGYFLQSIQWYKEYNRPFLRAQALMDYGLHLLKQKQEDVARSSLQESYRTFKSIGAHHRTNQLAAYMPKDDDDSSSSSRHYLAQERLATVLRIGQEISSTLKLNELIQKIMSQALQITGAQRGFLFLRKEQYPTELELVDRVGLHDELESEYSQSIVNKVFQTGSSVISTNAASQDEFASQHSVVEYGLKSILCVPIRTHEETLGVCYLDNPLSSSVFSTDDAELLTAIMTQAGIAIENAALYQNLEEKVHDRTTELQIAYEQLNGVYKDLKQDLTIARRIQENLLPKEEIRKMIINCHSLYIPMAEVGGDLYDVFELQPGLYRFFIADATGHGIQASLVTMLIKSTYEAVKSMLDDPKDVISQLNDEFISNYVNLTIIFTALVCDLDLNTMTLRYCSAGHPASLCIRGRDIFELPATDRLIGMMQERPFKTREWEINQNDRYLLLTDGMYEQFNQHHHLFGEDRLKNVLLENNHFSLQEQMNAVIQELYNFIGDTPINDDITAIGFDNFPPVIDNSTRDRYTIFK